MRLNDHKNTPDDYRRSRDLRNNALPFEKKLWVALREMAAMKGLKFKRQQVVHPYIADFACMEARLLIELDGQSHDVRQDYDRVREEKLKQMGFFVMRFSNEDVAKNVGGVVATIVKQAERFVRNGDGVARLASPLPNPPREGEGIMPGSMEKEEHNA